MLEGNGTTYDHDAVNAGWKSLTHQPWVTHNIMSTPIIEVAGSPSTKVGLTGAGRWPFQDHDDASSYGTNPFKTRPNAVTGGSLKVGEGACVKAQGTSAKSGGNHHVLPAIRVVNSIVLTVQSLCGHDEAA